MGIWIRTQPETQAIMLRCQQQITQNPIQTGQGVLSLTQGTRSTVTSRKDISLKLRAKQRIMLMERLTQEQHQTLLVTSMLLLEQFALTYKLD